MEFAQLLLSWLRCFHAHSPNEFWMILLNLKMSTICSVFWWDRDLQFSCISSSLTVSFSIAGHKWDGAHGEAGLAKCHDVCHGHIQVLWDLTSPSHPPCSCSTIRATQALLSSQQPLNPTVNCYTSLTPFPTHSNTQSRCMSVLSI